MNREAKYLIEIIEKIGTPILKAVGEVSLEQNQEIKVEAENIAVLLGKTVQASIDLGNLIDIEKMPADQTESVRVALAAIASPIIAAQYTNAKKAPGDTELKKAINALEAVMTFSDNFSISQDNIDRLNAIHADKNAKDPNQINIQYISAFIPVLDVIATYSFGTQEKKLIQDASDRIIKKAENLASKFMTGQQDPGKQKLITLSFVKSLAELYKICHKKQIDIVMGLNEPDQAAIDKGLSDIWSDFDLRASLAETLISNLIPGASNASSSANGGQSPAQTSPITAPLPPASPPPTEAPPVIPPQTPPQQPEQQAAQTPPPIFQKPVAPPTASTPPTTPLSDPSQQQPPPVVPPQTPPASTDTSSAQTPGDGPMGFFAKPGGQSEQSATTEQPATIQQPITPPAEQAQQPPSAPPVIPPQTPPQQPEQQAAQTPPPIFQKPVAPPTASTPPTTPPSDPSQQQPPPVVPPQTPPTDQTQLEQNQEGGEDDQGNGGGPMSFFKK